LKIQTFNNNLSLHRIHQLVNFTIGLGKMTDDAFLERSGMALQGNKFKSVTRLAALGNGVGRVVAGLAVNASMAF